MGAGEPTIKEPPGPAHQRHQIAISEEHQGGLAPEGEASVGGRGLDLAEWLALVQPTGGDPMAATPVVPTAPPPGSPAELATLVERWVKRVALGGDQRRGVARLDIGQGQFAGTELLVVADAGEVSVELNLPAEASAPGLEDRLRARLEQRGFSAEVIVR